MTKEKQKEFSPFREKIHEVIFESDTKHGKIFDILLLIFILASVIVVMLETVPANQKYHDLFIILEWGFTIFFTIEYFLRLYCVYKPLKYAGSFFGIIDLLAILPTYISIFFVSSHYLTVIRGLRLLRVFRIFKMVSFMKQGKVISDSLKASRPKIAVFLFAILVLVTIMGSIMYVIEGHNNEGFDSIPRSIYWAIVTMTTVGYGDITPVTSLGQVTAALIMIMGYSIIAVPTGIISAEIAKKSGITKDQVSNQACRYCSKEGHDVDAVHCKFCGEILNEH
jgi:voltage-gated potassium channel